MRIGIRLAVSGLVLASIAVTAIGVHALWWRTAQSNSRLLLTAINAQIAAAVEEKIESLGADARAVHAAIRTLFVQNVLDTREADKREFVFLSQLQSRPAFSWIAFGWPDGTFFAAHKLGDDQIEMMEIEQADGVATRRVDRYRVLAGDIEFEKRSFMPAHYVVTDQPWYKTGIERDVPRWSSVTTLPNGREPAIVFAGPIDVYQKRQGVLAIIIEHTRLSRFLAQLMVGKSGMAFILGPQGSTIAVPDAEADEVHGQKQDYQPLLTLAHRAAAALGPALAAYPPMAHESRQVLAGVPYALTLTPLGFPDWTLATVIPESEFLGEVDATTRRLLIGLLALVAVAGLVSAWFARRAVAAPLVKVAEALGHVQRFELDRVRAQPSHIAEIENLSGAIADMANGLSAFRKYIPAELVRTLIAQGVEVRPGGTVRPMSVLFADIAGFTGLSERMGDRIVPVLTSYFDVMSREIHAHGGTIDKFIGDSVMAFWGAPADHPDHALAACKAALACQRALRAAKLVDDKGRPIKVRIGINSGSMLVGNIGSEVRLNYTVIGDAVNVASRLEAANKQYGSEIMIGEETRRLAGEGIHTRELDRLMVYGRLGGVGIHELLGIADRQAPKPDWVALYQAGLAAYRARNFAGAIGLFQMLLDVRECDRPALVMIERCRQFLASPPAPEWDGTYAMESK